MSTLFTPAKIGRYTTRNRIFMAPMSRYRSYDAGKVSDLTVEYYDQRASAGLIMAESTSINNWSGGMNTPGIYTAEQTKAWKKVTDAVHAKGGLIFLQLWHSGRATHESVLPDNRDVVAPSAIASNNPVMTGTGMSAPTPPREITLDEIAEIRRDFETASKNALEAGFDGVELHAAGGFLLDTFLQETTNQREDVYGGSLENRYRLLGEVLEDSIAIWGADRVGVKLSPTSNYNDVGNGDVLETFSYVIKQLDKLDVAFLEVNEEMPFTEPTETQRSILESLRALWSGPYIANGNYDAETGTSRINEEKATAITFGRLYIANPDLPERMEQNAEMNELDMDTFYGGDHHGYTDYPSLQAA